MPPIRSTRRSIIPRTSPERPEPQPAHRFEFTFTPTHGSWLNLIEGFFSKLARSVLRHIRVASKQELKDRIMAAMDFFNQKPVVHTWTYKLDRAV
jgi:transposase